jgi:hypothetical protein
MSGKAVIEINKTTVFTFELSETINKNPDVLPGNEADPQVVTSVVADQTKYTCAFTGKHDHGALPEQKRGSKHENTLLFLQEARQALGDFLSSKKDC